MKKFLLLMALFSGVSFASMAKSSAPVSKGEMQRKSVEKILPKTTAALAKEACDPGTDLCWHAVQVSLCGSSVWVIWAEGPSGSGLSDALDYAIACNC